MIFILVVLMTFFANRLFVRLLLERAPWSWAFRAVKKGEELLNKLHYKAPARILIREIKWNRDAIYGQIVNWYSRAAITRTKGWELKSRLFVFSYNKIFINKMLEKNLSRAKKDFKNAARHFINQERIKWFSTNKAAEFKIHDSEIWNYDYLGGDIWLQFTPFITEIITIWEIFTGWIALFSY